MDNQTSPSAEAEESVNRLPFLEIAGTDSTEDLLRAVLAEAYGIRPDTEAEAVDNRSGVVLVSLSCSTTIERCEARWTLSTST